MFQLNLNKNWRMHESFLNVQKDQWAYVHNLKDGWYSCDVPVDVRMPLLEKGVIKDPVKADYCRESEWIEKRAWWFEKSFSSEEVDLDEDIIELIMEGLDTKSDIFVNGQYIGSHQSVHYPFKRDIKGFIRSGDNTITVRLTSGLETVSEQDIAEIYGAICMEEADGGRKYRGDARRPFVRRPQYTVGWDWGPKVITCGITGNVRLEGHKKIAVREVYFRTVEASEDALLNVMINIENIHPVSCVDGEYTIRISYHGKKVFEQTCKNKLFTSGYNYFEEEIRLQDAQLWWPNGYGKQPLYDIEVEAACQDSREKFPGFQFGIRTVELDTSILGGDERTFSLVVNGKHIYCKGGNWIPNDFIYARVPDEKYRVLIDEAVEANFNMLRVWGGGLYERDLFYQLCEQKGILLWHDFMLACTTYPDHLPWFREEMRKEIDYQTKRLRNHCSIGLFCGTNELHWLFNSTDNPRWDMELSFDRPYGMYIPNVIAKEIIHANCPSIPYWNSSPYGGERPNGEKAGDIHFWWNAFMSTKMEERIEFKAYDKISPKFVSEYGYVGPCCKESIEEYLDGTPLDREGEIWEMHTNGCEKGAVYAAIEKTYGIDGGSLSLEEYIKYGGMIHGMMYQYSLESFRFEKNCGGSLFWMYNDAWGEVGWTIVDYYLRRKIAYYGVKRALAHQKFTVRIRDQKLILQGINDTPEKLSVKGIWGYVSFNGTIRDTREVLLEVDAGQREYILEEKLPEYDYKKGTIMLYVMDEAIDNIWLRLEDMKDLELPGGTVQCMSDEKHGNDRILTVSAETFVHGVYVDGNYHCSDNYFDLLPGEKKKILIKDAGDTELMIRSVG